MLNYVYLVIKSSIYIGFRSRIHLISKHLATFPWWRNQMETFSALLALCAGNSPVTGEFPSQRPVTQSFDVFLICAWINNWVNNRKAGDLRRHRVHYDVTVTFWDPLDCCWLTAYKYRPFVPYMLLSWMPGDTRSLAFEAKVYVSPGQNNSKSLWLELLYRE